VIREEIEQLLSEQRTVRIGFAAGEQRYLLPFGYVWHEGSLCGVTSPGRKLDMAREDARVSFQVDTAAQEDAIKSVLGHARTLFLLTMK
jgi:nitroimidazol reductase NimA-like FMN-containing flavoprotein (pyridoxamine 5'-phosphate oxidase superfamily)